MIVTSRQEKDLEKSLKTATKFNIKSQNLENDITAYVMFKMTQLCQRFKFTQEREQLISKEICTRPMGNPPLPTSQSLVEILMLIETNTGMFLLARLIMDNLLSQDTLEDLNEELRFEVLPFGINEAYVDSQLWARNRTLKNIPDTAVCSSELVKPPPGILINCKSVCREQSSS